MICQQCGVLEASVHFSDPGNSPRKFQWLCPQCADMIVDNLVSQNEDKDKNSKKPTPEAWDPTALNAEIANSKKGELLGKIFGITADNQIPDDKACSRCGLHLAKFRQSGLLGCPHCYVEFREVLRPFLARLHGHKSHLGRIPGASQGAASSHVQIMRMRVDLEKAIAAEEFEKAARLRDEISALVATTKQQESESDGA